jgi:UPF0755 protein
MAGGRWAIGDVLRSRLVVRLLPALLATVVLVGVGAAIMSGPVAPGSDAVAMITIPNGASSRHIAQRLEQAGIIRDQLFFRLFLRVAGADARVQAGEYNLGPGMSMSELVSRLVRGQVALHPVTIPEGLTVTGIIRLLADRGWGDLATFEGLLDDRELRPAWMPEDPRIRQPLEGYLFPDTYFFPRGMSERAILLAMRRRFDDEVDQLFKERAGKLDMTVHEVVTLASIIEREAQIAAERPVVAAVFHNRLRRPMRLESCATVRYALDKAPDEPLFYRDLESPSPYNTYRHDGLPPGPIAAPGRASLQAALFPAEVKYLFFVARGDGSHAFALTLAEHGRNVRRYGAGFR